MDKLCSVITPAYNSAGFIRETIRSVRAQTYPHWEMIVVDDSSKDGTARVVAEEAREDGRIRLITNARRSGQSASRNAAIRAARGRYIAFLDSDDLWATGKLERQIGFMRERGCALSYTGYRKIGESGAVLSGGIDVPGRVDYNGLLMTNVIACLTAVYDTGRTGKVYLNTLLKAHEDYALWLEILKTGHEAHGLNECLASYRIRKGSVSRNKLKAAVSQWKVYREAEGLPLHKSMRCFVNYVYHGYRKSRI